MEIYPASAVSANVDPRHNEWDMQVPLKCIHYSKQARKLLGHVAEALELFSTLLPC